MTKIISLLTKPLQITCHSIYYLHYDLRVNNKTKKELKRILKKTNIAMVINNREDWMKKETMPKALISIRPDKVSILKESFN